MTDSASKFDARTYDKNTEFFHKWAKRRFQEVRNVYPNLVWNQPIISAKRVVWKNLQGSMQVNCLLISRGRKVREVYIDNIRRTDWDFEE